MYHKKTISGFIPILLIISLAIISTGVYLFITKNSLLNKITNANNPPATIVPTLSPSPQASPIATSKCTNNVLGVSLSVPEGWTCKSQELSNEDGWIDIKSDFFTIVISNVGRGPYCGDGEPGTNVDDSCRTSTFLSNNTFNLLMYSSYGENKEIMGGVSIPNKNSQNSSTWISIKYNNMEKQNLTESQKQELLGVLNTLSAIK